MGAADLDVVLAVNNAACPAVNPLDLPTLERLLARSRCALVAETDRVAGFVVVFGPRSAYRSENYRYFDARFEDFAYIDRVVVAPEARGRGVGATLYRHLFDDVGACRWTCEVNLHPPNPGSLAFHHALGFAEVGRQRTEGGAKLVALLSREAAE